MSDPTADLPTTPEALLDRLAALEIAVECHRHPPLHTVEDSKALRGALPGGHCKNLFLKDKKGELWLVVTLEDTPLKLNQLHPVIGAARLSFGNADLLWQVLGVRPGAVTPFALINDRDRRVSVVLDAEMMQHDRLNYHPLVNDRTVTILRDDLVRFITACGHTPRIVALAPSAAP